MLSLVAALSMAQPDVTGPWVGYWQSDANGHRGPLRMRAWPTRYGGYRAVFAGRFWGVIPFLYPAKLRVTGVSDDAVSLTTSQPLGPGLGTFRADATATPTDFVATFRAKRDGGRFVMRRR